MTTLEARSLQEALYRTLDKVMADLCNICLSAQLQLDFVPLDAQRRCDFCGKAWRVDEVVFTEPALVAPYGYLALLLEPSCGVRSGGTCRCPCDG